MCVRSLRMRGWLEGRRVRALHGCAPPSCGMQRGRVVWSRTKTMAPRASLRGAQRSTSTSRTSKQPLAARKMRADASRSYCARLDTGSVTFAVRFAEAGRHSSSILSELAFCSPSWTMSFTL